MAAPTVDTEALMALRGSMRPAQFAELMGIFSRDLSVRLRALDTACEQVDRLRLAREAHLLLGSASNMGALALAEASRRIEETAPSMSKTDMAAAIETLMTLAATTQAELDRVAAGLD